VNVVVLHIQNGPTLRWRRGNLTPASKFRPHGSVARNPCGERRNERKKKRSYKRPPRATTRLGDDHDRLERPCSCVGLVPLRQLDVRRTTRNQVHFWSTQTPCPLAWRQFETPAFVRRGQAVRGIYTLRAARTQLARCKAHAAGKSPEISTNEIRAKEPETRMFLHVREKRTLDVRRF